MGTRSICFYQTVRTRSFPQPGSVNMKQSHVFHTFYAYFEPHSLPLFSAPPHIHCRRRRTRIDFIVFINGSLSFLCRHFEKYTYRVCSFNMYFSLSRPVTRKRRENFSNVLVFFKQNPMQRTDIAAIIPIIFVHEQERLGTIRYVFFTSFGLYTVCSNNKDFQFNLC